jgi:molecular chaperone DnaJ
MANIACWTCGGRGPVIEQACSECAGLGEVEREQSLTVKIPPGAADSMVLRVAERGSPSRAPRGVPGDLLVVVRATPDPVLRLRGKGLPELDGKRRGDLHVRIHVRVPTPLGADERHLYGQLRALPRKGKRQKP